MNNLEVSRLAVQELANENFNLYRNDYLTSLNDALFNVRLLANNYFDNRNVHEIKRDDLTGANADDYARWISLSLCDWLDKQDDFNFNNLNDLFDWCGLDLSNSMKFSDLKTDNKISADFPLIHTDDRINFVFDIVSDNGYNSVLNLVDVSSI